MVETVFDYITNSHVALIQLISKSNFPDSIAALSTGLGMIFNHLGRISICRMFGNDYDKFKDEIENMTVEESYIGERFLEIESLVKGFLSKTEIQKIGE